MEKEPGVYEYSKKYSPVERWNVADQVKGKRREYFGRKKELEGPLTEARTREEAIKKILGEIDSLEDYQRGLESSLLSKITHFIQLRSARNKIGNLKSQASQQDLDQARADVAALEAARFDRREIEEAKHELAQFWQEQTEKAAKAEEASSVEAVMSKYDAIMIHALAERTPHANSLIKEGFSWREKLEILLAFGGMVSCSGVNGDRQGTFADVGVIFNRGRIISAHSDDAGTVAKGLRERSDWVVYRKGDIVDDMDRAMAPIEGFPNAYNEFVVEDGEIAGMFLRMDYGSGYRSGNRSGLTKGTGEVFEVAHELGIPFYFLHEGQLFGQNEEGKWDYEHPVTPEEIAKSEIDLTEVSQELREKYLADSPFKNPGTVEVK